MSGILVVVIVFFALAAGLGVAAYFTYQKKLRRAKAIERGLKMVPILIHLPPPSSDTQGGSRDLREVMREKTSQAEVLYNLLAGTATEGFKSNFYGQRHIALELIVIDGMVHFYAAVPVALVSVMKKAVQTAYPGARLEEVEDHNIFNQEGRLAATLGGEMVLRAESAYPIATYDQLERDPMEALLTTVSALEKQDGVAIQIMLRPAGPKWIKRSVAVADSMRKGRSAELKFTAVDLVKAAVKSPSQQLEEDKAKTGGSGVSNLKLSQVERIEDKTKHPGFEVLIRVIVSTGSVVRSQQLLRDIATAFALFENPGLNGFKFLPALDVQGLVTAFIFRFFPNELSSDVLNSAELATLFHLPDSQFTPTRSVERQTTKQVDGPVQLPAAGLLFGFNEFRGVKKEIRLSTEDRRRHTYILGQTGTGKSTMLENLAVQDMLSGNGFAFIDPHGDSAEKLLALVPKNRSEDVIYFNPADGQYPLGLNLFEFTDPTQKDFIVQETINMLYKLYDPGHTGIIGPRYEHWYRNAALTLMADPNGSTFIEIPKVFTDTDYLKHKFKYLKDPTVIDFWTKEMGQTSDYHKSEMLGWFVSKFGAFQNNEIMRNIIGQTKSSFNIRDVMDKKKILIVNLSKGRIGELNSQLLGMIFVIKFQAAAMSRADMPEDQRTDFSLYVDEFQNFSTDSFASILSEARKYRLNLIVANQFIGQLSNEIRDAVFGNIGTIIAHRMGPDDAEFLVKQFAPVFDASDLMNIPNYQAAMRLMVGGLPSQPFSISDSAPLGTPNAEMGLAIKQLSAAKYGRDKSLVEADLLDRMTSHVPKPAVAAPAPVVAPAVAAAVQESTVQAAPPVPVMDAPVVEIVRPVAAVVQPVFASAQIANTAGSQPLAPASMTAAALGFDPALPPIAQPVPLPVVRQINAVPPVSVVSPADISTTDPLAALSVATSGAPAPQMAPPTVASTVPPIGAPPIGVAPVALEAPVPLAAHEPLAAPAPVVLVPPRPVDASDELAKQMAVIADRRASEPAAPIISPLEATGPVGPTSPPPIGAPPVDLPGLPTPVAAVPQSSVGTLSFADITEGKVPSNVSSAEPSALDEVPLLASPIEQPETGNGQPLPNDPYANIDILGEVMPPASDEPVPILASEPPVNDRAALPNDPYAQIDILGAGPVGVGEVQVLSEPELPQNIEPDPEPEPALSEPVPQMITPVVSEVPVVNEVPVQAEEVLESQQIPATVPEVSQSLLEPVPQQAAEPVSQPIPEPELEPEPEPRLLPEQLPELAPAPIERAGVPIVDQPVAPELPAESVPVSEVAAVVAPAVEQAPSAPTPQFVAPVAPPAALPVADWSNAPEPAANEPVKDVSNDSLIHFVDPADEKLLNNPDVSESSSESDNQPSMNGLPDGVALVTPEVAVAQPLILKPVAVPLPPEVPLASQPEPAVINEPVVAPVPEPKAEALLVSVEPLAVPPVTAVADPLPRADAGASIGLDEALNPTSGPVIPVLQASAETLDSLSEQAAPSELDSIVSVADTLAANPEAAKAEPEGQAETGAVAAPPGVPTEVDSAPAATPAPAATSSSEPVMQPGEVSQPVPEIAMTSGPETVAETAAEPDKQPETVSADTSEHSVSELIPEAQAVSEPAEEPVAEVVPEPTPVTPTEPISAQAQIQKAEHEIDDLVGASLIHSDNKPGHRRLVDAEEPKVSSGDDPGVDLEMGELPGSSDNDKASEGSGFRPVGHHGLKVVQPLAPIVPPKQEFANELAELHLEEKSAVTQSATTPATTPTPAPAPTPAPTVVAAVPAPASAPVPVVEAELQDVDMPEAESLAADDVAEARLKDEAVVQTPQAPVQAPSGAPQVIRNQTPRLPVVPPEAQAEPEQAPSKADKKDDTKHGSKRRHYLGGRSRNEKPAEEITSKAERDHNEPSKAAQEAAPLAGTLILPTGAKPSAQPKAAPTQKPKKLAPGEVYVDETGNVIIGE